VKVYWLTAGLGALVMLVGAGMYFLSDQKLGTMLVIGGLFVSVLGLVMRFVMIFMGDKSSTKTS
jgi:hypothetical protein